MVEIDGFEPSATPKGFLLYRQMRPNRIRLISKMEEDNGVQPSSLAGATAFKTVRLCVDGTLHNCFNLQCLRFSELVAVAAHSTLQYPQSRTVDPTVRALRLEPDRNRVTHPFSVVATFRCLP